jgi:Tol biopolymer transport system component
MSTTPDIFLSYNREDQATARLFAEGFERAGFKAWWDQALKSGIDYDKATEHALRGAKAVVVLWSKQSVESRWVRTEATIALQNQTLVPVTIEPCQRPIMFELTQTADLSHWHGDANDPVWLTFLNDVQQFVESGAGTAAAASSSLARMTGVASKRRHSVLAWSLCALFALTTAALSFIALQQAQQPPPAETRLELVTPATDSPMSFALSPDGRQIVFTASADGETRLWLRNLASTTAQPLAGTEGASAPFWSPDGKSVAFFANAMLKRLDLGSLPQNLVSVINGQGGSWNADGTIIYAPSRTTPLQQIAASGGMVTEVTALGPQHLGHYSPHFLPDDRRFLFFVQSTTDIAGIYLGSLDGAEPIRITAANSPGVYHPSGRLLWVRDGTLLSQTLDINSATLTGESIALADGLFVDSTLNKSAFAVSAAGQIAYRTGASGLRQLTWFDRQGNRLGTLGEPDPTYISINLSPDGQRVALSREVQNNRDIWVIDAARTSRLTFDDAQDLFPVWSPEGSRLILRSNRIGAGDLYEMSAASAGGEQRIMAADQLASSTDWSRDGRFALYIYSDAVSNGDIHLVSMDAKHESAVFLQTPYREAYGMFSPDGRWVAYHSNASGRLEVYVRPFTEPGDNAAPATSQWQISTDGGIYARWSEDGSELFYLDPDGALVAVPIVATATAIEPGAPQKLFTTPAWNGGVDAQQGHQYDVAPDGRFIINAVVNDADQPITLIQNWQP